MAARVVSAQGYSPIYRPETVPSVPGDNHNNHRWTVQYVHAFYRRQTPRSVPDDKVQAPVSADRGSCGCNFWRNVPRSFPADRMWFYQSEPSFLHNEREVQEVLLLSCSWRRLGFIYKQFKSGSSGYAGDCWSAFVYSSFQLLHLEGYGHDFLCQNRFFPQ